jgi:hypothetical protein
MARFAAVEMGSGGELSRMGVPMAIQTGAVFHAVECVTPGGQMTLGARHCGVFSEQRIRGLLVPGHGVERWFPAVFRMAICAILLRKLFFVRI